jgi:hypothetical protein
MRHHERKFMRRTLAVHHTGSFARLVSRSTWLSDMNQSPLATKPNSAANANPKANPL